MVGNVTAILWSLMSLNSQAVVHQAICVQSYDMATGERFAAHVHDEHQLVWASAGVVTVEIDDQFWVLPPSLALLVPAGVTHATSATKPTLMRGVYLGSGLAATWSAPTVVAVDELLRSLLESVASDRLDTTTRPHAEALILDLLRPVSVATISVPLPSDGRVRAIADELLASPADDRSLADWGRSIGAGERTLSRLFVAETGMTFGHWRTHARLRAALVLLADGTPVARVARDIGFRSASAFVASFRQSTGCTPKAYFRSAGHQAN